MDFVSFDNYYDIYSSSFGQRDESFRKFLNVYSAYRFVMHPKRIIDLPTKHVIIMKLTAALQRKEYQKLWGTKYTEILLLHTLFVISSCRYLRKYKEHYLNIHEKMLIKITCTHHIMYDWYVGLMFQLVYKLVIHFEINIGDNDNKKIERRHTVIFSKVMSNVYHRFVCYLIT